MFSWFRKPSRPMPEPEQPAAPSGYVAESQAMFAHLIAAIDAVDTAHDRPTDGRDSAAGGIAMTR